MYEVFWKISFATFLAATPLNAAHALIALSLKESGEPQTRDLLRWVRRAGNALIGIGLAGLTAAIAARWVALGYPPFSNMPESLLWMAWAFCAMYFVARLFVAFAGLEFVCSLGAAGILAASTLFGSSAGPLMPVLRSNWLIFHVFTCMVSYGAFFAAFCIALLWLTLWRKRESQQLFDALVCQVIAFGFLMLTVGIVSGAAWGNQAWGRYWGWDPKETWALITWLVYAIYLHLRPAGERRGVKAENLPRLNAVFAIGGFAALVFTYVGVNYLLRGLHSYAGG
jgi:cytochrome c-type biogenesis protein CcsB